LHANFPSIDIKTSVNKIALLNSEHIEHKRIYKAIQQFSLA